MSSKMYRSRERVIAGVAGGLAQHLGVSARNVRLILAASSLFFGAGIVFYAWLWMLVPLKGDSAANAFVDDDGNPRLKLFRPNEAALAQAKETAAANGSDAEPAWTQRRGLKELALGFGLLMAGIALFGGNAVSGVAFGTMLPVIVIGAGAVLAWSQLDASRREGFFATAGFKSPLAIIRFIAGVVLVIVGVLIVVIGSGSVAVAWGSIVASLAVLAGVALVLAPWALKFWRDFQDERTGRIKASERAEIGAHLHDSVLQTLALIQKRADSPQDVLKLARAQERELRQWIYQESDPAVDEQLVARVKAVCAEVEDLYGQAVEVVAVGDAQLSERGYSLVQATREAVLNAARHGGTTVSVYLEANEKTVDVFIKDRGKGFDLDAVPSDRLGVKESLIGRMQRNGGQAEIISSSDGTEVRLHMQVAQVPVEEKK